MGEYDSLKIIETIADPILREDSLHQKPLLDLILNALFTQKVTANILETWRKKKQAENFTIILVSVCIYVVDVTFHFYFCTKLNSFESQFPLPAM